MTTASPLDDRVTCTTCRHLWPGNKCLNHRRAGLNQPLLSAALTQLPQRCPGFTPKARPPPAPATAPDRTQTEATTEPQYLNQTPFELDYPMIISDTGGAAFTPCPAGSYLARCVRLVDLGTQSSDYQGETKTARKVLLAFEILDDETRRDDGSPFALSKRYTASLHEKSALRKDLASWRGRDFTPEELKGFDLANVLGKDCFISVVEQSKPDGRVFSNLASIMKPPKGMRPPEGTCNEPLLHWDMAAPDWTVFAQLHPKLQQQIEASPEFKALKKPRSVTMPTPSAAPAGVAGSGFDDMPNEPDFDEATAF